MRAVRAQRREEAARDRHMAIVRGMGMGIGHALGNMLIRPMAAAGGPGADSASLADAVGRLSRFSRLLQGHHEPGDGPTDVVRVVDEIVAGVADAAVTVKSGRTVPAPDARPGTVNLVLAPLVGQAVTRGRRATIGVFAARVTATEALAHHGLTAARYARIAISDDGPPLDRNGRVRLFEPTWAGRGEDAIALYAAHRALTNIGGHVCAHSTSRGLTVTVYLPIDRVTRP